MCKKVSVMWESETVVLVTSLKRRILGGKRNVRFQSIASDDALPIFIKNLFKNQIKRFIKKESPISIQATEHFAFESSDLEILRKKLSDIFWEVATFNEKEVEAILKEALILRMNYLVKPMDTMHRLLFEDGQSVEVSEMEERLESFKKVLPYAEQLLEQCRKRGESSINREIYSKRMTEVLHSMVEEDPVKIVLRDVSVLLEFLSETKGEEISKIEGSLLKDFLTDRGLEGFRRALDVELKLGREDFTPTDLEMTFKRYLELKHEFSKSTSEKEEFVLREAEKGVLQEESPKGEQEVLSGVDEWNLEDALDEGAVPVSIKHEPVETRPTQKPKPKTMRIIRREQKEEKEEAPKEEVFKEETAFETDTIQAQGEGLDSLIDEKTGKVFVKKLFGGDEAAYEDLIKKLDEAESWRAAKVLIDNELFKREVDPFSREAIKLVDLIYSRYYPEEGIGGKR